MRARRTVGIGIPVRGLYSPVVERDQVLSLDPAESVSSPPAPSASPGASAWTVLFGFGSTPLQCGHLVDLRDIAPRQAADGLECPADETLLLDQATASIEDRRHWGSMR
jgi:hypothetical protein